MPLYDKMNYTRTLIGSYCDLLKDRHGCRQHYIFFFFFAFLLYKTNRFRVAVVLSKNKSEKRQNVVGKSVTHSIAPPELLFCSQLAIG